MNIFKRLLSQTDLSKFSVYFDFVCLFGHLLAVI